MAKFLGTEAISSELVEIIRDARERLWLVSPFLKVNPRLRRLLEDTNRSRDIDARVIYGKNDLQPDESIWLEGLASIRTMFCKDLHAKCYLNEHKALLTSMNLYEYSQVRNYEMGILVLKEEEPELYDKVCDEARLIMRASEEIRVSVARVTPSEDNSSLSEATPTRQQIRPTQEKPNGGFCIRCKADLPANPSKPYCDRCYQSWNQYKNAEYKEKQCHLCGKEHAATLARPVCRDCYRKHRALFESATA